VLVGQNNKSFFANAKAAAWWHATPVLSHSPHAQSGGRGFNYRFDIQASHASAKARILGDRERLHCFRMALIYGQSPVIGQLVWAWELELASSPLPKGSSSGVVYVKPGPIVELSKESSWSTYSSRSSGEVPYVGALRLRLRAEITECI
jgi:hypothetical protein